MPQTDFNLEKRHLLTYSLFCFAFGTILALIFIFFFNSTNVISQVNGTGVDSGDYIAAATALLNGDPYPKADLQPFFRPPMYPIFMASLWWLFGRSDYLILFTQAILFGFTCFFIFKFSQLFTKNLRLAVLGSVIYATHPFCLYQVTGLQTEVLHTFLFTGAVVLLLYSVIKNFSIVTFLITGMAWGIAALTRPSALPIAILLALTASFFYFLNGKDFFQTFLRASILILGIFLTILPWTYCNYLRTHELILINDAGGHTFWLGNLPSFIHLYDGSIKSKTDFDEFVNNVVVGKDSTVNKQISEFERTGGYEQLPLKARESRWWNAAFENIKDSPSTFGKLFIYRIWDFWRPYLNPIAYSSKVVLFSGIYFIPLFILSGLGLFTVFKIEDRNFILTMLAVLALSATLLHALFFSTIRYRLPYIDPYLCGLAGIGIFKLFDFFINKVRTNQAQ